MDTLHIGSIITTPQLQDAIHIAIAPIVAARALRPGEHVGLNNAGQADVFLNIPYIGIVDPFLLNHVKPGEKFWLFLYPGSITSLKHFWTHPAFEKKPEEQLKAMVQNPVPITVKKESNPFSEAMDAVEVIADGYGLDAEELLEAADSFIKYGEYFSQGGRFEGEYLTDDFWPHYEIIRGVTIPSSKKHSFFTCSC